VQDEANSAHTDRRRQQPPELSEELASFLQAHVASVPLQLRSVTAVTSILAGGKLGSFYTVHPGGSAVGRGFCSLLRCGRHTAPNPIPNAVENPSQGPCP
jgi:hypothetical protein